MKFEKAHVGGKYNDRCPLKHVKKYVRVPSGVSVSPVTVTRRSVSRRVYQIRCMSDKKFPDLLTTCYDLQGAGHLHHLTAFVDGKYVISFFFVAKKIKGNNKRKMTSIIRGLTLSFLPRWTRTSGYGAVYTARKWGIAS